MPSRISRITNAQRAGFCGLMIAGLSFSDACGVVDVSQQRIHRVIPDGWCSKPQTTKLYNSWKGEKLEQLRLAYADQSRNTRAIASEFGIELAYLYRLAVRHGWPRRVDPRRFNGRLTDTLTREQHRLYSKLRSNGVSRPEAYAEALR